MNPEMHPDVADMLQASQQMQQLADEHMHKLNTQSFKGTDETKTVEVTINAHRWLTDLYIKDGLLRLGTETVAQRINEAINNALASANAAREGDQQQFLESLNKTLHLT